MTREEAKQAAEVMMAYADGKKIEFKTKAQQSIWREITEPVFDWSYGDYRIKPEPTYRPFKTKEECWAEMRKHQPFGWLIDNETKGFHSIVALSNVCLYFSDGGELDYENLFKYADFADGTPFGIKEE